MKQEIFKELNDFFAIIGGGNKYVAGGYQVLADSIMKIVEAHEPKEDSLGDSEEPITK